METPTSHLEQKEELTMSVIRFAGDSGDGMQLAGDLFTSTAAMMGENVATLPDYPAEIRAPQGTVAGVSGFQICFGSDEIYTPGDFLDVLVAMNPPALKVNLSIVKKGGVILVNEDSFSAKNLEKAGMPSNPLLDQSLKDYDVYKIPIQTITKNALAGLISLSPKQVDQCKNLTALGLTYRLFNRKKEYTLKWLERKFKSKPEILQANKIAFEAGWEYGEHGVFKKTYTQVKQQSIQAGTYRQITGNIAAALGLVAASRASRVPLFLGSYPITPATDILQELSRYKECVTVFQAEDEIAAIGAALGASYGGSLAATTTSGPGFSLKSEFINLAVISELPMVIVNVQRVGPSTGLPTKTEQADLFQALWGRHGESPVVVMAAQSPKDCFYTLYEASRVALRYMTPVIVLSDGLIGNGSEVWKIPAENELPEIKVSYRTQTEGFLPYDRDHETLARPWAIPGTPGLEHRIGGLEKEDRSGKVSHAPLNHEKMVKLRAEKVARVASEIKPLEVFGDPKAKLLVLGWGSTYGVIRQAVQKLLKAGYQVACLHLRYLNPLPNDLKETLEKFPKVLVPENNMGQLWYKLRAEYLIDIEKLNKVQGQPFCVDEVEHKVKEMLANPGVKYANK
ncbi:MAG: 2-oxoacid:acceptor oxidoreductase subunit alpha [Deltaproteobacteria bacterium]|nr:2-oxoacid:acceptor oxidoreductase subunit alpha [Deltaproteobacteria bacterium]